MPVPTNFISILNARRSLIRDILYNIIIYEKNTERELQSRENCFEDNEESKLVALLRFYYTLYIQAIGNYEALDDL